MSDLDLLRLYYGMVASDGDIVSIDVWSASWEAVCAASHARCEKAWSGGRKLGLAYNAAVSTASAEYRAKRGV